jgi:hypothetical protein
MVIIKQLGCDHALLELKGGMSSPLLYRVNDSVYPALACDIRGGVCMLLSIDFHRTCVDGHDPWDQRLPGKFCWRTYHDQWLPGRVLVSCGDTPLQQQGTIQCCLGGRTSDAICVPLVGENRKDGDLLHTGLNWEVGVVAGNWCCSWQVHEGVYPLEQACHVHLI